MIRTVQWFTRPHPSVRASVTKCAEPRKQQYKFTHNKLDCHAALQAARKDGIINHTSPPVTASIREDARSLVNNNTHSHKKLDCHAALQAARKDGIINHTPPPILARRRAPKQSSRAHTSPPVLASDQRSRGNPEKSQSSVVSLWVASLRSR